MDGNQRYVSGQLQSLNEDLAILKAKTAEKQEPFAAMLSCADSRVPVEFVFDQSIGHLFVVRVAGNITTPEIIGEPRIWGRRPGREGSHGVGAQQLRRG